MYNDSRINPEHIKDFSRRLTTILESELSLGNTIVETHKGWSTEEMIMIFLRQPFYKTYSGDHLEYYDVNDPHYWKAEYQDKETDHVLACGF